MYLLLMCITITQAVEFQLINHKKENLWIGIQGNPGHPDLSNEEIFLKPGQKISVEAPSKWAGRFWAQNNCNWGTSHCSTRNCNNRFKCNEATDNSPASLAEITLNGESGLDSYHISLVEGFNLPISIEPLKGSSRYRYSCKKAACQAQINDHCPTALQVRKNSQVIGCMSACQAFNTNQYCCRGVYRRRQTCQVSNWPVNYSQFFKKHCPDAFSHAYDKKNSFTCKAQKYLVSFGK